jgi:hypothetical protein
VTAEDGHVYSRKSISDWIETCQQANIPIISPTTRIVMGSKLVDNIEIKRLLSTLSGLIMEYKWEPSPAKAIYSVLSCDGKEVKKYDTKDICVDNKENVVNGTDCSGSTSIIPITTPQDGVEKCPRLIPPNPMSLKNMSSLFHMLDITPSFTDKVLPNWVPPCITVIGNESSGKSTILERLLMMSIFPRGEDICTRYVLVTNCLLNCELLF